MINLNSKNMKQDFEKFAKIFDESFGKITADEFIEKMKNSGYVFQGEFETEKKPKEYNIKTVEDMFKAVTIENVGRFLIDFKAVVANWLLFKAIAEDKKIKQDDINSTSFKWIDDGTDNVKMDFKPKKAKKK